MDCFQITVVLRADPKSTGQEEKGMTEDEMAGWRHWLDGCESEWTLGVGDGQGGLACCDSWGCKELDTTERLNWTELNDGCCTFLVDALFYSKEVPSISSGPNLCFSVLFSSWKGVEFCQIAFLHLLRISSDSPGGGSCIDWCLDIKPIQPPWSFTTCA